jgi:hypothetical protein
MPEELVKAVFGRIDVMRVTCERDADNSPEIADAMYSSTRSRKD